MSLRFLLASLSVVSATAAEFSNLQRIQAGDTPDFIIEKAAHVVPTARQLAYLPRQDKPVSDDMIEEGHVEVSTDGTHWKNAGTFVFGNLLNDPTTRTFQCAAAMEATHLRITSTKGVAGKPYAGAAEIGILSKFPPPTSEKP